MGDQRRRVERAVGEQRDRPPDQARACGGRPRRAAAPRSARGACRGERSCPARSRRRTRRWRPCPRRPSPAPTPRAVPVASITQRTSPPAASRTAETGSGTRATSTHAAKPSPRARSSRSPALPARTTRAPAGAGQEAEEEAERAVAQDRHRVPGPERRGVDRPEAAGHGLGERDAGRLGVRPHRHQVARHQARRQRDVLGVGAVDEEEIVAEVRLAAPARRARPARRRVRGDRPVPGPHPTHARPDRGDRPRELVAEDGRHPRDHHGMAAPEGLHVRAAGQRGLDPEHHLTRARLRDRRVLEPEIAGAVEDLRSHRAPRTPARPGRPRSDHWLPALPISTKTLSASRRSMRPTASARRSSGTRCEQSSATRTAPLRMRSKASARSAGDDE